MTFGVAPFAGAWIEMDFRLASGHDKAVAPFAGAWIEIEECIYLIDSSNVAPFAGAWIEMLFLEHAKETLKESRTLRGCVD